ncbi:MAG: hypothetical protein ACLTSG_01935 [Lachnospiraceae bacterium]
MRRRLMDAAISQLRPGYAAALSDYNRMYEQKAAILRDWREKPSLLDTLDDFSERLCRLTARLTRYRASFVQRLGEAAAPINRDFSGGADEISLRYRPVSTVEDPFASERDIYYAVCEHQEGRREAELASGQCLTGAHKDDIEISVNGRSARSFASQGQARTAALSDKIGRAGDLPRGDRRIPRAAPGRRALGARRREAGVRPEPHRRRPDPHHLLRGRRRRAAHGRAGHDRLGGRLVRSISTSAADTSSAATAWSPSATWTTPPVPARRGSCSPPPKGPARS